MISGQNLTSPRQELFVTSDLLIQGDWKLITGRASSASWAGPTYPNASSVNNTLDRYTADCTVGPDWTRDGADGNASAKQSTLHRQGASGPCLYNVGNTGIGDWTEHENLAAAYPDVVSKMMARLVELRPSIWSNPDGTLPYEESCVDQNFVWWNENSGFCECRRQLLSIIIPYLNPCVHLEPRACGLTTKLD